MELELSESPENFAVDFNALQTGFTLISTYEQKIFSYSRVITIKEEVSPEVRE